MPAATLLAAAQTAYDQVALAYFGNVLPARFTNFINAIIAAFPGGGGDNSTAERTVSNWVIPGKALIAALPAAPSVTLVQFNEAAQIVYRVCWAANVAVAATPARITAPQAAAILASFNVEFP